MHYTGIANVRGGQGEILYERPIASAFSYYVFVKDIYRAFGEGITKGNGRVI